MKISKMWILILCTLLFSTNILSQENKTFKLKRIVELQDKESERFPDDPAEHKAVYMWNSSDENYQKAILNSLQAMIKMYNENVDLSVVVIGPGIDVLAKKPRKKVDALIYERVEGFAKNYNVRWIACGNTMQTIGWKDKDMRPFSEYAKVGAAALMELQEEGYKLIVW